MSETNEQNLIEQELEQQAPEVEAQPDIKGTEARNLRYDFSATEIYELSVALANKNQEHLSLENAKKSSAAKYKAQIEMVTEEIGDFSNKVASGYEYRSLQCEVIYDKPGPGQKTLIRPDTGKIFIEQMTEGDYAFVAKAKQPVQTEMEF